MHAAEFADRITTVTPAAGWWVIAVTGLVALAIALAPALSPNSVLYRLNVLGVLVHELGHAVPALATSGRVHRLVIASPDGGSTKASTIRGWRSAVTDFAGYASVPLAGLGAAALVEAGHTAAVVALLGAAALVAAPLARGLLTIATVIATVATAAGLLWLHEPALYTWAAHTVTWLLLFSGLTSLLALLSHWWAGKHWFGDASNLHRQTGLPWWIWVTAWAGIAVWCLWTGGVWLWT